MSACLDDRRVPRTTPPGRPPRGSASSGVRRLRQWLARRGMDGRGCDQAPAPPERGKRARDKISAAAQSLRPPRARRAVSKRPAVPPQSNRAVFVLARYAGARCFGAASSKGTVGSWVDHCVRTATGGTGLLRTSSHSCEPQPPPATWRRTTPCSGGRADMWFVATARAEQPCGDSGRRACEHGSVQILRLGADGAAQLHADGRVKERGRRRGGSGAGTWAGNESEKGARTTRFWGPTPPFRSTEPLPSPPAPPTAVAARSPPHPLRGCARLVQCGWSRRRAAARAPSRGGLS